MPKPCRLRPSSPAPAAALPEGASSHAPMLSHREVVLDVIRDAARSVPQVPSDSHTLGDSFAAKRIDLRLRKSHRFFLHAVSSQSVLDVIHDTARSV